MKTSVEQELAQHIIDCINDGVIDNTNKDDWHFHCFNEDYYIVYHSAAKEWLKRHDLDTFEAIEIVKEYEDDNFGEMITSVYPESIVNMLTYIWGEELIYSENFDTVEELEESMKELVE